MSLGSLRSLLVLVLGAGLLVTCGGGGSPSAGTTPPPTAPPSTNPPAASPAPAQTTCARLGLGTGTGHDCPRQSASFQPQLEAALDKLLRERPEVFNFNEGGGPGIFQVRSVGGYLVGLIEKLEEAGLCADYDGEELQIKESNSFNDQYDVLTSNNMILRGSAAYKSTCYPAAFPTPMPALAPTAGCSLPPSKEKACGRESERFLAAVTSAIDQVQREHREIFDFNDFQPGTDWLKVINQDAFIRYVTEALTSKGLCAKYDGEEMAVKNDNKSSDQYDIISGTAHARRDPGMYRSTCYPAAF